MNWEKILKQENSIIRKLKRFGFKTTEDSERYLVLEHTTRHDLSTGKVFIRGDNISIDVKEVKERGELPSGSKVIIKFRLPYLESDITSNANKAIIEILNFMR